MSGSFRFVWFKSVCAKVDHKIFLFNQLNIIICFVEKNSVLLLISELIIWFQNRIIYLLRKFLIKKRVLMNTLRLSTFFDRFRNSNVDLDDIIEENAEKVDPSLNQSTRTLNEFYLMLYFTANWLPSAFNKCLNNRLEQFFALNQRTDVQLILISSDKTKDSFYEFLNENKFIRYSLIFHEQDIKVNILFFWSFFLSIQKEYVNHRTSCADTSK